MTVLERQYLKDNILLAGVSDGRNFTRKFYITGVISEGASVVCYEASHEGSSRGTLREYYPLEASFIKRDENRQLVLDSVSSSEKDLWEQGEKQYLMPYETLLAAKKSDDREILATFIPSFEIYHGCDENGVVIGSTYIWTPDPKLETFDHICDEIHENPEDKPEHKLVKALTAIETLTKCICALHEAELIHRDIKPSNFGFMKRGTEILTQAISMFDINSICSVYDDVNEVMGSVGYLEPESGRLPICNQTDIYAIGATLFHAIIVTEEARNNNYTYSREMYRDIALMVDESRLIQASENNSHPRLRHAIATVLKKSLAKRSNRYTSCEEMLEDIEKALYYALPSEVVKKNVGGAKWVLNEAEKKLDPAHQKNSNEVIRFHLYNQPLYKFASGEMLNVLIAGFGNYSQRFLDICLQMGQMPNKKLSVTVVSDSSFDRDIYIKERPALGDFFDIDCDGQGSEDSYGKVSFFYRKIDTGSVEDILDKLDYLPSYVFIALGDDVLNLDIARTMEKVFDSKCHRGCISYATEKKTGYELQTKTCGPVYVNAPVEDSVPIKEILRMAKNTHDVWQGEYISSTHQGSSKSRKEYNVNSSIDHVIYTKYTLYALGIDLDEVNVSTAKNELIERGLLNPQSSLMDVFCFAEHKRWVTEKVCQGYRRLDDMSTLVRGNTKDIRTKKHICLVKSMAELDVLSKDYHKMYVSRAHELRKSDFINDFTILGIGRVLESIAKCKEPFLRWYDCMTAIWNGNTDKISEYEKTYTAVLDSLVGLPVDRRRAMREHIKAYDLMFYPIIASQFYLDFRYLDQVLIEKIPDILTK